MIGDWSGLVVVSATPLMKLVVEALLRAGVTAVVAPGAGTWEQLKQGAAASEIVVVGGFGAEIARRDILGGGMKGCDDQMVGLAHTRLQMEAAGLSLSTDALGSSSNAMEEVGSSSSASQLAHVFPKAGLGAIGAKAASSGAAGCCDGLEMAIPAFCTSFYDALFSGETVLRAINIAERSVPYLDGLFVCYHL
jgi:hypothetical protein